MVSSYKLKTKYVSQVMVVKDNYSFDSLLSNMQLLGYRLLSVLKFIGVIPSKFQWNPKFSKSILYIDYCFLLLYLFFVYLH